MHSSPWTIKAFKTLPWLRTAGINKIYYLKKNTMRFFCLFLTASLRFWNLVFSFLLHSECFSTSCKTDIRWNALSPWSHVTLIVGLQVNTILICIPHLRTLRQAGCWSLDPMNSGILISESSSLSTLTAGLALRFSLQVFFVLVQS